MILASRMNRSISTWFRKRSRLASRVRRKVVATDLATEHGGTDANKRDGARQVGRLNVDDLQL
jgi:hypothetical protein